MPKLHARPAAYASWARPCPTLHLQPTSRLLAPLSHPQCGLASVGEPFLLSDVGLGLHGDIPLVMVDEIDAAILHVVEEGRMEQCVRPRATRGTSPPAVSRGADRWQCGR